VISPTLAWWYLLCAVSLLNALGWVASVVVIRRRSELHDPETWTLIQLQMLLSAGYVFGCAYRSIFPVYDVMRLCLVDSWLSSVIVGRSVATFAELCFAAQWALLLRGVSQATRSPVGVIVSRAVVPMIAVAELCSWYAVLTTYNLGHVLEESIWGLCGGLLVASFLFIWPRCKREFRPALSAACLFGLAYVVYMFMVDVPMYWARWVADTEQHRQYLGIVQGLVDASQRWIVSDRWADWQTEVGWMSLYFSVAVWLSIIMIHLPGMVGSSNASVWPASLGDQLGGSPGLA
jgi:hypothetical protein